MPDAIRPIEKFRDDVAPAQLMLQVYRLLDSEDRIHTDGELVDKLRQIVAAAASEELMVLQNEIFTGIIRERADLPRRYLRAAFLCHLLRQAIVVSCTAMDAFLPAVLREHLETAVRAQRREFVSDPEIRKYFDELHFSLEDVLRARWEDGGLLFIANKVLTFVQGQYLVGAKGVIITCGLLGIDNGWDRIASRLDRPKRDLLATLKAVASRRNDIVHRSDRPQSDPGGEPVAIGFSYANQGVETITTVCNALHELVTEHMATLRESAA